MTWQWTTVNDYDLTNGTAYVHAVKVPTEGPKVIIRLNLEEVTAENAPISDTDRDAVLVATAEALQSTGWFVSVYRKVSGDRIMQEQEV
jgi:hypothetical protein